MENRIMYAALDTQAEVYWEKPQNAGEKTVYHVYVNGTEAGSAQKTHFTLKDLEPETEYAVAVTMTGAAEPGETKTDGDSVKEGDAVASCQVTTKAPRSRVIDVTKAPYNAAGDGVTKDTKAIQAAIDACGANETVFLPKGTYLTGALDLHSDMELLLDAGARIVGSEDPADYLPQIWSRFEGTERLCYRSLLNLGTLDHTQGPNCRNVVIRGIGQNHPEQYKGCKGSLKQGESTGIPTQDVLASLPEDASAIIGGGMALANAEGHIEAERLKDYIASLGDKIAEYETPDTIAFRVRGRLINMSNCSNIRITGLTLGYGAAWNLHFIYSDHILTDHCFVRSDYTWNGDGWDPDSSSDCTLFACDFYTGDDMVAIKSGHNPEGNVINIPTKDITVFDCKSWYGNGLVIGSEISGGVEGVYVWDCDTQNSAKGFEIKATKKRGAYVRDVHVRDMTAGRVLVHAVGFNDDGEGAPVPPVIEDCHFENMYLTASFLNEDHTIWPSPAILLSGFDVPGYELHNITFKNIRIGSETTGGRGAADDVVVDSYAIADVDAKGRQLIILKHCKDVSFEGLEIQ